MAAALAIQLLNPSALVEAGHGGMPVVMANVNVSTRTGNQTEATVAINPTNAQQIFVASNDESTGQGVLAARSNNAGANWTVTNLATNADGFTGACCDPSATWDQFGNLFFTYLNTANAPRSVELLLSTDGGANWTSLGPLATSTAAPNVDQPTVAVGAGSVWVSYRDAAGTISVRGAQVTGLGAVGAFGAAQVATNSNSGNFGDIAIGPAGQVMVTYQIPSTGQGPATIFVNVDADGLGAGAFGARVAATTTNVGGFDFFPAQPDRSVDAEAGLAYDRSGGPRNGRVYLVYTDEQPDESNDLDIFVRFSNDNGANWSAPVQVNDDATMRTQFLPRIALDQTTGDIAVSWHDARGDDGAGPHASDLDGTANNDAQFWGSFSFDGGANFVPNFQISQGTSDEDGAEPPGAGFLDIDYGDYTGAAFQAGILYPVWADNSNSTADNPDGTLLTFDIYTARIHADQTPPLVGAGSDVSGAEGTAIALSGTASDPDSDPLTISWSFVAGAGVDAGATCLFADPSAPATTITCSDDGTYTATLTADDAINPSVSDSTTVTVSNADPVVTIDPGQVTEIDEGEFLNALATFSDTGWNDTYSSLIDWGTGDSESGTLTITSPGPPQDQGQVTGSHQYGDNGDFTVTITVTDDDLGEGSDFFVLQVDNVAPTAEIDETGAILIGGTPTFLAHVGEPISFSGGSTDPGSDDLDLSWDWDDGAPSPDVITTYLVNPPLTDPFPSPSVQPRDETDVQPHTFGEACLYEIQFLAEDDDGGSASDVANVVIVGIAERIRSVGYWQHQFRQKGKVDLDPTALGCYLEIVNFASAVFSEERPASTLAEALDVLEVKNNEGDISLIFDRQLLGAWLNFANGAVEFDELVDTDGDGVADNAFSDALAAAEAVRLDPTATREELEAQKDILERINLIDD